MAPTNTPTSPAETAEQRPNSAHGEDRRSAMPLPGAVSQRVRINWSVALSLLAVHVLALAALAPWLFSWSGLALMLVGLYAFGTLGINVCYHRLLTHRSFKTPRWVERLLTVLGLCNLQGSSISWVTAHRRHHQHSDHEPDPHSPLVNFLWSHVGWLLVDNPDIRSSAAFARYAGDLCRDPFHMKLERYQLWVGVWVAHVALFFLGGFLLGWAATGAAMGGVQLGLSWLVWGVLVRMVIVWHITWGINSVTHLWGYRNYETRDDSRNNLLLGYLSMGEGWHNNHHADQRSAAHGHRWWELDISYLTIRLMEGLGMASGTVTPKRHAGTAHDLSRKQRKAEAESSGAAEEPPGGSRSHAGSSAET